MLAKNVRAYLYFSVYLADKIVIHTEPAEREILYPNHSFCRQLKFFNKKLFKELDASIPGLREDRAQLQKMLGTVIHKCRPFPYFSTSSA